MDAEQLSESKNDNIYLPPAAFQKVAQFKSVSFIIIYKIVPNTDA